MLPPCPVIRDESQVILIVSGLLVEPPKLALISGLYTFSTQSWGLISSIATDTDVSP